jgi:hypothetical protein
MCVNFRFTWGWEPSYHGNWMQTLYRDTSGRRQEQFEVIFCQQHSCLSLGGQLGCWTAITVLYVFDNCCSGISLNPPSNPSWTQSGNEPKNLAAASSLPRLAFAEDETEKLPAACVSSSPVAFQNAEGTLQTYVVTETQYVGHWTPPTARSWWSQGGCDGSWSLPYRLLLKVSEHACCHCCCLNCVQFFSPVV